MGQIFRYVKLLFKKNARERIFVEAAIYGMIPIIMFQDCEFEYDKNTVHINIGQFMKLSLNMTDSIYRVEIYDKNEDGEFVKTARDDIEDANTFIKRIRLFFENIGYEVFMVPSELLD
jgi:hypothetical protein